MKGKRELREIVMMHNSIFQVFYHAWRTAYVLVKESH